MSAIAAKLWTIEDLERMEPNGKTYELLRGELIEMSGPKYLHMYLVGYLISVLGPYARERKLGMVGNNGACVIRRDPDTLLIPDVTFIRQDRLPPKGTRRDVYPGPPDAAFEVVSPSDTVAMVREKIAAYLDGGVIVVVIVWPDSESVSVHRANQSAIELSREEVLELDDVLPGFRLSLADLFADE